MRAVFSSHAETAIKGRNIARSDTQSIISVVIFDPSYQDTAAAFRL